MVFPFMIVVVHGKKKAGCRAAAAVLSMAS